MPGSVRLLGRSGIALKRYHGVVTFEDRLEVLDRQLHLLTKNDCRTFISDLSSYESANGVTDQLYFTEVARRRAHLFRDTLYVIYHPPNRLATPAPLSLLMGGFCEIREYHALTGAPVQPLIENPH